MSEDLFDRLDKFMLHMGLNDNQVTVTAGLSVGSLGKQRKGARGLSSDSIAKLLYAYPDLNANWLFTGEGYMLKTEEITLEVPEKEKSNVIAVDFAGSVDTVDIQIVDIYAAAGHGAFNSDHFEQLGTITLPANMVKRGTHYCVRIKGSSMAPTIQDSDYVIVRLLDPSEWECMPDEHVYLVVDRDGAAYMKRVKNRFKKGFIVCTSDSIEKNVYPNFNLDADEVFNIFHAEWHLSAKMQNINETYYDRLKLLEDDMTDLKDTVLDMREYIKRIR